MCMSRATCLSADWPTNRVGLVQSGPPHWKSSWYRWTIAELALSNNYSLTLSGCIVFQRYSRVFDRFEKKKESKIGEKLFVQIQNLGPRDVFVSCVVAIWIGEINSTIFFNTYVSTGNRAGFKPIGPIAPNWTTPLRASVLVLYTLGYLSIQILQRTALSPTSPQAGPDRKI